MSLLNQLLRDEQGFVVSAELVLIATVLVIALIVCLSQVASAVNNELNDVGNAFAHTNQSYRYSGMSNGTGGSPGSSNSDSPSNSNIVPTGPVNEGY